MHVCNFLDKSLRFHFARLFNGDKGSPLDTFDLFIGVAGSGIHRNDGKSQRACLSKVKLSKVNSSALTQKKDKAEISLRIVQRLFSRKSLAITNSFLLVSHIDMENMPSR